MTTAGANFIARVYVSLKPAVNDPQGLTIRGALHSLGFGAVDGVRAGKYLELHLLAADHASAQAEVDAMCRQLLANPVIEDYRFSIEPAGPVSS